MTACLSCDEPDATSLDSRGSCPMCQLCRDCDEPHGYYAPASDCLFGWRCESCEEERLGRAVRARRDAEREAYGDWMRDEGKDRRPL